jgi:hypothetical protein
MERDGSLSQFRLEIRQGKCIEKLLESASVAERAPEEKSDSQPRRSRRRPGNPRRRRPIPNRGQPRHRVRKGWFHVRTRLLETGRKTRQPRSVRAYQRYRQMSLDDICWRTGSSS